MPKRSSLGRKVLSLLSANPLAEYGTLAFVHSANDRPGLRAVSFYMPQELGSAAKRISVAGAPLTRPLDAVCFVMPVSIVAPLDKHASNATSGRRINPRRKVSFDHCDFTVAISLTPLLNFNAHYRIYQS